MTARPDDVTVSQIYCVTVNKQVLFIIYALTSIDKRLSGNYKNIIKLALGGGEGMDVASVCHSVHQSQATWNFPTSVPGSFVYLHSSTCLQLAQNTTILTKQMTMT